MKSFRALAKHIESISIISFVFEDGTITLSSIFSQLILGRFILNAIVENQFENWSNECASVCVRVCGVYENGENCNEQQQQPKDYQEH